MRAVGLRAPDPTAEGPSNQERGGDDRMHSVDWRPDTDMRMGALQRGHFLR